MIIICEPLIKGFGHEKVNSGFLSAIRLANPNEEIVLFADLSHIIAIKNILTHDDIDLDNIRYLPINFNTKNQLLAFLSHFKVLKSIIRFSNEAKTNKILFLSASTQILYLLNFFNKTNKTKKLQFSIVMHGFLEILVQKKTIKTISKYRLFNFVYFTLTNFYRPFYVFENYFSLEEFLVNKNPKGFKYLLLSEHIRLYLDKIIDTSKLNFQVVDMPTNFRNIEDKSNENKSLKIAMFGRGDYKMLIELAKKLEFADITRKFEIRIIGKDYYQMENFKNIKCSSPGVKLSRKEMESQTIDIDLFLILYDTSKYNLSCSASIYESMSYLKPIIHLDNTCINFYNNEKFSIGYKCMNLDEMSHRLTVLINNYESEKVNLNVFKSNLLKLRNQLSYQNNTNKINNIF